MRIALTVSLLATLAGCALPMGLRHNEVIDGNSITYVTARGDGPTVVFESGLGDGLAAWDEVYAATSGFASVFAYSRPGYSAGFNTASFGDERTADESAGLLRRLLEKTRAPEPYILVGHSIGGLYLLEFAQRYPDVVAGVVLVDARLPGFTERCQAAGLAPCLPPSSALLTSPLHIQAEIRGIRQSERNAPDPEELGDVPAILLAATEPPPGAPSGAQPIWLAVQKSYAESMQAGDLWVAEGSGHYIQHDQPALVVEAIRTLLGLVE